MSIQDNIKKLISNEESVENKLKNKQGLERFLGDVKTLMSLVKDYRAGEYKKIPLKTIAAAATGVLYAVNPIDIIPDSLPVVGAIDDVMVLGFCLKMMESDLAKYRRWKAQQTNAQKTAETVTPNA